MNFHEFSVDVKNIWTNLAPNATAASHVAFIVLGELWRLASALGQVICWSCSGSKASSAGTSESWETVCGEGFFNTESETQDDVAKYNFSITAITFDFDFFVFCKFHPQKSTWHSRKNHVFLSSKFLLNICDEWSPMPYRCMSFRDGTHQKGSLLQYSDYNSKEFVGGSMWMFP